MHFSVTFFFVDKFQLLIDKTTSPHFTWLLQLFFGLPFSLKPSKFLGLHPIDDGQAI